MTKKNNDFSKKNDADLVALLNEKREALRVFRFGEAGGHSRNVRAGRELRQGIARILTELTSRTKLASSK